MEDIVVFQRVTERQGHSDLIQTTFEMRHVAGERRWRLVLRSQ